MNVFYKIIVRVFTVYRILVGRLSYFLGSDGVYSYDLYAIGFFLVVGCDRICFGGRWFHLHLLRQFLIPFINQNNWLLLSGLLWMPIIGGFPMINLYDHPVMAELLNFIMFLLSLLIHRFMLLPIMLIPWYNNPLGLMVHTLHPCGFFEFFYGPWSTPVSYLTSEGAWFWFL